MAHAKKRRPEEVEGEEEMHLSFRGAANALSHMYTQAMAHQKASFLAGERHAMENVYRWISSRHEEASKISVADVVAYLQNEIEHIAEDMPASPQHQFQHSNSQPACNFPSANIQSNSFSFGNLAAALNPRMGQADQTSSAGISTTFPDPPRQTSHAQHVVQSSEYGPINSLPNESEAWNNHSTQNQEHMSHNAYDPSMDMHHDAPS